MDDFYALILVALVAGVIWTALRIADEVEDGVVARFGRAAWSRASGLIRSRAAGRSD